MTQEIPLTRGAIALVDDDDYPSLSRHKWALGGQTAYAVRYVCRPGRSTQTIRMHREILGLIGSKPEVDHINHDRLDNRRANLRAVTRQQNNQNRQGAQANSSTGVRGVTWHRQKRRYRVRVYLMKRQISLGYFRTLEEARLAAEVGRRRYYTHSPECADA